MFDERVLAEVPTNIRNAMKWRTYHCDKITIVSIEGCLTCSLFLFVIMPTLISIAPNWVTRW